MMSKNLRVLTVGLFLLGACGDKAKSNEPAATAGVSGNLGSTAGTSMNPGAGSGAAAGTGAGTSSTTPGEVAVLADGGSIPIEEFDAATTTADEPCDYEMEEVQVATDLTIPAGTTVHVCAGVTFEAVKDAKVVVLGELLVDGTAEAPVSFLGSAAMPRAWHGIVVESGGTLKLSHTKIGGAIYGVFTNAGSTFVIDRTHIDTSFKAAVIQSNGAITNSTFIASVPPTIAVTEGVSIDDPNGALTIINASPAISNCDFDGASAFTDLIRVGGNASPTFDHVSLSSAHCGFHTSGGTNTSILVTNAIIENMSYGIMAYATKPIFKDSVFRSNSNDIGLCNGATNANAPVLMNNHYASGSLKVDASCFMIGTAEPSPAATPNPSAGPSGL